MALDPARAVQVVTLHPGRGGRRGSGYRVTRDLVLTAEHVVRGAPAVMVRSVPRVGTTQDVDAELVWSNEAADIAVLRLAGPPRADDHVPDTDASGFAPVRYGRIQEEGVVECDALGFPLFKMRSSRHPGPDGSVPRFRESHHARGEASTLSNRREGKLEFTLKSPPHDADPAHSPWEGMSGAAVWSGGRLVGIVVEHHQAEGSSVLTAGLVERWYAELDREELGRLQDLIGLPRQPRELAPVGQPTVRIEQFHGRSVDSHFVGRREILDELHARFHRTPAEPGGNVQALLGPRGFGKSQIALRYAQEHRRDYDIVVVVPARDHATALTQLAQLAGRLGLARGERVEDDALRVRDHLAVRDGWLLVLDGAEDVQTMDDFIPWDANGHVIVTSWFRGWEERCGFLDVPALSPEEASHYLLHKAGSDLTPELAERIAEATGYAPIVLAQAADLIGKGLFEGGEYLALLDDDSSGLLSGDEQDGLVVPGYGGPVGVGWREVRSRIGQRNPSAVHLLELCSFFAEEPVPLHLLRPTPTTPRPLAALLSSPVSRAAAVGALRRFSQAQIADAPSSSTSFPGRAPRPLGVHSCTQRVVRAALTPESWAGYASAALSVTAGALAEDLEDPSRWEACGALLPHASTAAERALRAGLDLGEAVALSTRLGEYLVLRGLPAIAVDTLGRARDLAGSSGTAREAVLRLDAVLVDATRAALRLDEARVLGERTLTSCREQLGPRHRTTLHALAELAHVYGDLGISDKAIEMADAALTGQLELLGADHHDTLRTQNDLAAMLSRAYRFQEAVALQEEVRGSRLVGYGAEHFLTLLATNNLADSYECLGRCQEAWDIAAPALEVARRVLPALHHLTIELLKRTARLAGQLGDAPAAADLFTELWEADRAVHGPTGPQSLDALRLAVFFHSRLGHWARARRLQEALIALLDGGDTDGDPAIHADGEKLNLAYLRHRDHDTVSALAVGIEAWRGMATSHPPHSEAVRQATHTLTQILEAAADRKRIATMLRNGTELSFPDFGAEMYALTSGVPESAVESLVAALESGNEIAVEPDGS
ncbi:FxSxx-COOH system tetratricopeptide repeat protein [Streptomyces sp. NPDC001443]